MQTLGLECQIAKAQITRYLAGDVFGPDALNQLQGHIDRCPDCRQDLEDRKSALQAKLGAKGVAIAEATAARRMREEAAATAVVETPAPKLISKSAPALFWKPLGYSAALACVIGAMSLGSRMLSQPMAESAGSKAEETISTTTADTPATAETKPPAAEPKKIAPTTTPAPILGADKPASASDKPSEPMASQPAKSELPETGPTKAEPKSATEKPDNKEAVKAEASTPKTEPIKKSVRPRRRSRRKASQTPRRSRPLNTIRVYDENGQPLSGQG